MSRAELVFCAAGSTGQELVASGAAAGAPAGLVATILAGEGFLTPDEADTLQRVTVLARVQGAH